MICRCFASVCFLRVCRDRQEDILLLLVYLVFVSGGGIQFDEGGGGQ